MLPGKTFHWSGEYEANMNNRRTLLTELGVFETFTPTLPHSYQTSPFVLLANIAPSLQMHVLDQMRRPKFVAADTMDLWLNIALPDLLKLLKRLDAFVLNDSEAHQLTKEDNVFAALKKIHKLGPKYVVIKKGSHGSLLSGPKGFFILSGLPFAQRAGPHRGGGFVCGRNDGLSFGGQRRDRCKHTASHDLRKCRCLVLLRRIWAHPHHEGEASADRTTRQGTGKVDEVLIRVQTVKSPEPGLVARSFFRSSP